MKYRVKDYPDLDRFIQYPQKFTLWERFVMWWDILDDGGW